MSDYGGVLCPQMLVGLSEFESSVARDTICLSSGVRDMRIRLDILKTAWRKQCKNGVIYRSVHFLCVCAVTWSQRLEKIDRQIDR